MTAVGVAKPMAHGQAMTNTATILINARVNSFTSELIESAGPKSIHPVKVSTACDDHRNENCRNLIDQFLDRCFGALCFFH